MVSDFVNYGIGENYLEDWGYKEALREIYQNFIDFGDYEIKIDKTRYDRVVVTLKNTYIPESLEFLQIGKSVKTNSNSIGKHGEGLKMAFLVLLRNKEYMHIRYGNTIIHSLWNLSIIGKTLSLKLTKTLKTKNSFEVKFTCPKSIFTAFNEKVITKEDIIFKDSYYGSIVNKPIGELYSGGLFVTTLNNLKKAYDIPPNKLALDRDRRIPSSFEVSYYTSKVNEEYLKKQEEENARLNFVDQNYDDYKYVTYVPNSQLKEIKVKEVLGKPEFVINQINEETKETSEILITNENMKSYLKSQPIFTKALNSVKSFILSKLGIKELLINFRKKYCITVEAKEDFDIILMKLGIEINGND